MGFELSGLPEEWDVKRLEDCVEERSVTYGIVQPGANDPEGVPMLRVNNFSHGTLRLDDVLRVSLEIESKYSRTRLRGGEVLLTLVGSVGQVAIAPPCTQGWNVARAVGVMRPVEEIGGRWLSICLRSPESQRILGLGANTTVQTTINLKDVKALPIPVPPRAEREAIEKMISSLDDKIALLRETSATLEAIAQAIFKSWFVDFDPVRAKAEGRDPEGVPPELANLFPSEFEDSDLGNIPKGWRVDTLDSIADFLNGLAMQKFPVKEGEESLPVIKIAQLRKGDTEGSDRASLAVPSEYWIQDGDVLFSWSGSLEIEIWSGGVGALNQHLFRVTSSQFPKWFYFLWARRHLPSFRETAANKATTMGHIQRRHLAEAKVVIPPRAMLEAIGKIIEPLIERQVTGSLEIRTIASLRDALLPCLMSGKLRASRIIQLEDSL